LVQQLRTLAQAWEAAGATGYSLWQQDRLVWHWPAGRVSPPHALAAPVQFNGENLAQLRVAGLAGSSAQARLAAEASLLSQCLTLEEDLDNVTATLIDSQDQLLALYNLTQAARHQTGIEGLLGSLAKEVKRQTRAQGVFLSLREPKKLLQVEQAPASFLSEAILYQLCDPSTQPGQECLISATNVAVPLPGGVDSLFLLPIQLDRHGEALLGVLFGQSAASLSPLLKLARTIAEFIASQLENALLNQTILDQTRLRTELELAARIQLQLLPHQPPLRPDLDLCAKSQPALQVGGDFYDFISAEETPFTFIVGDVTGKGMPAALLMAMTRTVLRSKTKLTPAPYPEAVLRKVNEDMYDDFTDVGMFATVFIGQYNAHGEMLRFVNAGHSPVIFCPSGGTPRLLEADGPALGVLPATYCSQQTLLFRLGDVLVMATDGFSEARSPAGEMFGHERLMELVAVSSHRSAREISDSLFGTLADFTTHSAQDDDQTLVVIKRIE
jgi:sigma-B regulation protein RsbU (phosphoserine phosphatase)